MSEIVETDEALSILQCSLETLQENLRTGHLPGLKIGVPWIIPRRAFFDRLNAIAVEEARQRREPPASTPIPLAAIKTARRSGPVDLSPHAIGEVRSSK